jgi:hypothetical protein
MIERTGGEIDNLAPYGHLVPLDVKRRIASSATYKSRPTSTMPNGELRPPETQ